MLKRISAIVVAFLLFGSGYFLGHQRATNEAFEEQREFVEFARAQLVRFTGTTKMKERLESLVQEYDLKAK